MIPQCRCRSLSVRKDWAMPDQLVSTTVTALLKIASGHPKHRDGAFSAIVALVTEIVKRFRTADRTYYSIFLANVTNATYSLRGPLAIRSFLPWIIQGHHFDTF